MGEPEQMPDRESASPSPVPQRPEEKMEVEDLDATQPGEQPIVDAVAKVEDVVPAEEEPTPAAAVEAVVDPMEELGDDVFAGIDDAMADLENEAAIALGSPKKEKKSKKEKKEKKAGSPKKDKKEKRSPKKKKASPEKPSSPADSSPEKSSEASPKKEKKEKKVKKEKRKRAFIDDESSSEEPRQKRQKSAEQSEMDDDDDDKDLFDGKQADPEWDAEQEKKAWDANLAQYAEHDHDDDEDKNLFEGLLQQPKEDQRVEDTKPATHHQIDSITLSRTRDIAPHCHLFFFKELIIGSFIRVATKKRVNGQTVYELCEVADARPAGIDETTGACITYKIKSSSDGISTTTTVTDWELVIRTPEWDKTEIDQKPRRQRVVRLNIVSSTKATEEEWVEYLKYMNKHDMHLISQRRAKERKNEIWKHYHSYYDSKRSITGAEVEQIVANRKRLRGNAEVNLVRNKLVIGQELERQHQQRIADQTDDTFELPKQYEETVALQGLAEARKRYEQDMEARSVLLNNQYQETEAKLQKVLFGQNKSFTTLAAITHRNAEANKGRLEAEDPIDAIVFGRKQGRATTYWNVSENGFSEKEEAIEKFWKTKRETEQHDREVILEKRASELALGNKHIRDVPSFIKGLEKDLHEEELFRMQSQPSKKTTTPRKTPKKSSTPRKR